MQSRPQTRDFSGTNRSVSAEYPQYTTLMPPGDIDGYGAYQISAVTGIIAAGLSAASEIFQFRWAPTTSGLIAVVDSIIVSAAATGTAFAAGLGQINLMTCTGYTAAGSGGDAVTLTTANGKRRTAHAVTQATARVATTAALTAGTQTQLPTPLAGVTIGCPAVAGQQILPPFDFLYRGGARYPLVLANEEGFQIEATVPGTGTWTASIQVAWSEVPAFPI